MRKFVSILLLSLSIITLIACTKNKQQPLDGEYYCNTIELTGQNIASRTEEYSFKDGVFSVDIIGVKHDYYLKDSEAYNNALKQYGYK